MTASLLYAEDGIDWLNASPLELHIEAGYLRAAITTSPGVHAYQEELSRIEEAAKQRGIAA